MSFIGVRLIGVRSQASARGARVGEQRHLTRVLDRGRDVALVLRAVAGDPPGPDLVPVGDELAQQRRVLVIDVGDLLLAEQAHLLLGLAYWCLGHRGAPLQSPASAGMVGFLGSDQNGGSSVTPPSPASDAHGSSAARPAEAPKLPDGAAAPPWPPPWPPPYPPPDRLDLVTLADALRSDGPTSSTSTSYTVRFSPSLVS